MAGHLHLVKAAAPLEDYVQSPKTPEEFAHNRRVSGIRSGIRLEWEAAVTQARASGLPDPPNPFLDDFDNAQLARAHKLGVEQAQNLQSLSSLEAAKQSPGVSTATKTWVWSGLKNSRHKGMAGETVPAFTPFSNGMQYPGDPAGGADQTAGCRCHLQVDGGPTQPQLHALRDAERLSPGQLDLSLPNSLSSSFNPMYGEVEDAVLRARYKKLNDNFMKQSKLSDAQIEEYWASVDRYAGHPDFASVQDAIMGLQASEEAIRAANGILKLFAEVPGTSKSMTMWRSVGMDLAPGQVIEGRALTSVTASIDTAKFFTTEMLDAGAPRAYLRVVVPKGTRGINVDANFAREELAEAEFILPPGTNMRVTGKIGEIDGVPVMGVRLELPEGMSTADAVVSKLPKPIKTVAEPAPAEVLAQPASTGLADGIGWHAAPREYRDHIASRGLGLRADGTALGDTYVFASRAEAEKYAASKPWAMDVYRVDAAGLPTKEIEAFGQRAVTVPTVIPASRITRVADVSADAVVVPAQRAASSDVFTVMDAQGATIAPTAAVEDAFRAIDGAGGLPAGLPRVNIQVGGVAAEDSSFSLHHRMHPAKDGKPAWVEKFEVLEIPIGKQGDTVVHEIGHFVGSHLTPAQISLRKEIVDSLPTGGFSRYDKKREEIWARAYEQWVYTRSGSTALRALADIPVFTRRAEVVDGIVNWVRTQNAATNLWTDEQFAKVMSKMDELMGVTAKVPKISADLTGSLSLDLELALEGDSAATAAYEEFKAIAKLTDKQVAMYRDSVAFYSGNENYVLVQKALQGEKVGEAARSAAYNITSLFEEVPLTTREIHTWRGMTLPAGELESGSLIESRGLVSVSGDQSIAEYNAVRQAAGGDPVLLRIVVPKGSKVINVDGNFALGEMPEGELILNSDTKLRVRGKIGESPQGLPIYEAEVEAEAVLADASAITKTRDFTKLTDAEASAAYKELPEYKAFDTRWTGKDPESLFGSEELDSVYDYISKDYYVPFQKSLRDGSWAADAEFAKTVANIDRVMAETTLQEPLVAFRGFSGDLVLTEGTTITDAGYQSFSISKGNTRQFTGGAKNPGGVMRVNLQPGQHVSFGSENSAEIILPRGSSLRVLGRDAKAKVWDVEVVESPAVSDSIVAGPSLADGISRSIDTGIGSISEESARAAGYDLAKWRFWSQEYGEFLADAKLSAPVRDRFASSVERYAGNTRHHEVQNALLGLKAPADARRAASELLELFQSTPPVSRDWTAWRGMRLPTEVLEGLSEGSIIESRALTSVSVDVNQSLIAMERLKGGDGVLLQMVVKKGTRVINVDANDLGGPLFREGELILPPGTGLRVSGRLGVTRRGSSGMEVPVYGVEIVPSGAVTEQLAQTAKTIAKPNKAPDGVTLHPTMKQSLEHSFSAEEAMDTAAASAERGVPVAEYHAAQAKYAQFLETGKLPKTVRDEFSGAVKRFAGNPDYEEVQAALQGLAAPADAKEAAAKIMELFQRVPETDRSWTVFRGLAMDEKALEGIKAGGTLEWRGLSSTTVDINHALTMLQNKSDKGVLLRLVVPKGSKVINVDANNWAAQQWAEGELVLPPGTKMEIVGKLGTHEGVPVWGVRIVEKEASSAVVADVSAAAKVSKVELKPAKPAPLKDGTTPTLTPGQMTVDDVLSQSADLEVLPLDFDTVAAGKKIADKLNSGWSIQSMRGSEVTLARGSSSDTYFLDQTGSWGWNKGMGWEEWMGMSKMPEDLRSKFEGTIKKYAGDSAYKLIQKEFAVPGSTSMGAEVAEFRELFRLLPGLDKNIVAYRGMTLEALPEMGTVIESKALSSASVWSKLSQVTAKRQKEGQAFLMRMLVPKGTKALLIDPNKLAAFQEGELILPPGTAFRVVGKGAVSPDGLPIYDVEVILAEGA